jgi:hypothetical protein
MLRGLWMVAQDRTGHTARGHVEGKGVHGQAGQAQDCRSVVGNRRKGGFEIDFS